jgi:hypothetical protein
LLKVVEPLVVRNPAEPASHSKTPLFSNTRGWKSRGAVFATVATAPLATLKVSIARVPALSIALPPKGIVSDPVPASAPPARLKASASRVPFTVNVPPATVSAPFTAELPLPSVRLPPPIVRFSALITRPALCPAADTVIVSLTPGSPTSGMTASSPAAGERPRLQFAAVSHDPVAPVHVFVAPATASWYVAASGVAV